VVLLNVVCGGEEGIEMNDGDDDNADAVLVVVVIGVVVVEVVVIVVLIVPLGIPSTHTSDLEAPKEKRTGTSRGLASKG